MMIVVVIIINDAGSIRKILPRWAEQVTLSERRSHWLISFMKPNKNKNNNNNNNNNNKRHWNWADLNNNGLGKKMEGKGEDEQQHGNDNGTTTLERLRMSV